MTHSEIPTGLLYVQPAPCFSTQNVIAKIVHPPRNCFLGRGKRAFVRWRAQANQSENGSPLPTRRPIASQFAGAALSLLVRALADDVQNLVVDVDFETNADAFRGQLRGALLQATRLVFGGAPVSGGITMRLPEMEIGRVLSSGRPFAVSVFGTITHGDLNARDGVWFRTLESLLRDVVQVSMSGVIISKPEATSTIVTELERIELLATKPSPTGRSKSSSIMAEAVSFVSAAIWSMVSPGVSPYASVERPAPSNGKLVLHARTRLADGTSWRYTVQSRLAMSENGTVLEFDQPELIWRGIGLPLLAVARAGITLSDTTVITSIEITTDGICTDGVLVVDLSKLSAARRQLPAARSDTTRAP